MVTRLRHPNHYATAEKRKTLMCDRDQTQVFISLADDSTSTKASTKDKKEYSCLVSITHEDLPFAR